VEREGPLEIGSWSAPDAVTLRGPEAAAQQARRGGPAGRESESERRRSRRQIRKNDGGDRGAAGSLYSGQAARVRVARSGEAKPEGAANWQRFYWEKISSGEAEIQPQKASSQAEVNAIPCA
jgi:hypothetical protein